VSSARSPPSRPPPSPPRAPSARRQPGGGDGDHPVAGGAVQVRGDGESPEEEEQRAPPLTSVCSRGDDFCCAACIGCARAPWGRRPPARGAAKPWQAVGCARGAAPDGEPCAHPSRVRRLGLIPPLSPFPLSTQDTEFPGVVARPVGSFSSQTDYHYQTLRCNVDMLKMIQLGVTFADEAGNVADGCPTFQVRGKWRRRRRRRRRRSGRREG
jgi:hypothetical protein